MSFVLLKYFLCLFERLTAPYPLDLFCRSCMYLVWALQRLDPTYLMLLLKLLVCSDDGCKLSNKWWEVQNLKFKGNMSNIYIFFGQLSQLCELCLNRCHVYLYCRLHFGWATYFKYVSMPALLWYPLLHIAMHWNLGWPAKLAQNNNGQKTWKHSQLSRWLFDYVNLYTQTVQFQQ